MRISTIQNQMNFKSSIIISRSLYKQKTSELEGKENKSVPEPWTTEESIYGTQGYTDEASICTIGCISNKKETFMFHLIPEKLSNPLKTVKKQINEAAKKLSQNGEKLTGFITGGSIKDKDSIFRCNKIMNIFNELNIDYSAIALSKDLSIDSNLYFDAKKDEYILCPTKLERGDYLTASSLEELDSKEKLKQNFKILKIRKGDNLKFEEQL